MAPENASKDASPDFRVFIVHAPVISGDCVLLPASDLDDATRFGVWTRFYRAMGRDYDLWENAGWRGLAEALFRERIERAAQGDPSTLALLLAELPAAVTLPSIRHAINDALLRRNHEVFERLAGLLREHHRRRPAAEEARAWAKVQKRRARAFLAHGHAQAVRSSMGRPYAKRRSPKILSVRESVRRMTGEFPEDGGEASTLATYHQRFERRRRGLWQVEAVMRRCDEHEGQLEHVFRLERDPQRDWQESRLEPPIVSSKAHSKDPSMPLIAGLDG
jgi:hypothetical protein